MALYLEEEEVWKCPKHPSRRRRTGICPNCLRERLLALCPDCANVRPCGCSAATTSSSSSSSSSFSLLSGSGVGAVGRVSSLIDSEPALRRSRSTAIPFLRSRFGADGGSGERSDPAEVRRAGRSSFWSSLFNLQKAKKREGDGREAEGRRNEVIEQEDKSLRWRMLRSRSVGVSVIRDPSGREGRAKWRGWSFPSPIKVFRQSKATKVVQERSPLYRG